MYITIYIIYSVNLINIYIEKLVKIHLLTIKRIFRYLKGTISLGLLCKKGAKSNLINFIYSDNIED